MSPDELKAAARRCLYAKQFHAAGHVSSAMLAVVVADAAEQAFGALVGGHAADDSVQGRARDRLRAVLGIGEGHDAG